MGRKGFARSPIASPVFRLALETITGVAAWTHHSRDGGLVPDLIDGSGSLDLHIPMLKLQAGTFDLHASILDYTTTHTFDHRNGIVRFDVLAPTPHESGGVASLGGTWGNLHVDGQDTTNGSGAADRTTTQAAGTDVRSSWVRT